MASGLLEEAVDKERSALTGKVTVRLGKRTTLLFDILMPGRPIRPFSSLRPFSYQAASPAV